MHEALNASKCEAGIKILNASIIRKCRLSQDQQTINLFFFFFFAKPVISAFYAILKSCTL